MRPCHLAGYLSASVEHATLVPANQCSLSAASHSADPSLLWLPHCSPPVHRCSLAALAFPTSVTALQELCSGFETPFPLRRSAINDSENFLRVCMAPNGQWLGPHRLLPFHTHWLGFSCHGVPSWQVKTPLHSFLFVQGPWGPQTHRPSSPPTRQQPQRCTQFHLQTTLPHFF